ncbi:hypothetical protein DFJ74DRAFT_307995 [Hyaloraphidium curvatum]|nr:hypothetical protein DFJ74DRAFT_307995 [Hyaloraphidium curvatum]
MEELKREQEERDRRNRRRPDAAQLGSHDTGDGTSTNLYVGNLSPSLDEPALCREFGRYGAIASIKIMWPRNREERERGRNCGFVSFMDRQSAEKALKDMDGREVAGFAMRVGWGKPVPIPDRPYFVLNANQAQSAPAERTGLPFGARLAPGGGRARVEVPVRAPADAALRWRIHRTVERAVRYGPDFEAAVVERERGNETGPFAFLFDFESPEHVYYRWKLYSVLQGEPPSGPWRTTPFEMYDEGPAWSPPRPADADAAKEEPEDELVQTTDSDTDSVASEEEGPGPLPYRKLRGADRARLSPRDRRKLVLLLRRADLSRGSIAKAMAFCVDRADAAEEVVDLVVRSLLLPGTPVFPGKIARLYVLSDLLHNASSSVHNAWKFRALVQPRLAAVFAHLGEHWRRIPARLKAEQMRRAVMAAVEAWETWIVFPREQVEEWKAAFKGTRGREGEGDEAREELDGEPMDDVDGVPMEDVDGVPLDAPPPSKFAPIGEKPAEEADDDEDLDGAPIGTVPVVSKFVPVGAKDDDEEEDLDGLPMGASAPEQAAKADDDEDLDGVPM